MSSILELRKTIWFENKSCCQNYEPFCSSTKIVFDEHFKYPSNVDTKISIVKKDSIVASYGVKYPLILSFADNEVPGGCVDADCGNQEESIFRRTTIHKHLPTSLYPIKKDEAIYSPFVKVIYDSEDTLYKKLQPVLETCFVSCPGLKFPKLDATNNTLCQNDVEILEKKIELILQIAIKNNHKNIILGPIGCGAYGTPIKHTAQVFKNVIASKCNNCFESITFACLGSSYNIFNDVFSS
jgi:uncharacterized protein (TIGR02452 family)